MKYLLLALILPSVISCTTTPAKPRAELGGVLCTGPVGRVLADKFTPRSQTDLRELLLTLAPDSYSENETRKKIQTAAQVTSTSIVLKADGDWSSYSLEKLPGNNRYEFQDGWKDAIGTTVYTLERRPTYWQIIEEKTLTTGIKMAGEGPA